MVLLLEYNIFVLFPPLYGSYMAFFQTIFDVWIIFYAKFVYFINKLKKNNYTQTGAFMNRMKSVSVKSIIALQGWHNICIWSSI